MMKLPLGVFVNNVFELFQEEELLETKSKNYEIFFKDLLEEDLLEVLSESVSFEHYADCDHFSQFESLPELND